MSAISTDIIAVPSPFGGAINVRCHAFDGGASPESLAIAAGMHGDELDGIHIAAQLLSFLRAAASQRAAGYRLLGRALVIPVANPPALQGGTRLWPQSGPDLDLSFPGNAGGEILERLAAALCQRTGGSTYGVILQAAPPRYGALPHLQLAAPDRGLKRFARGFKLDLARELPETPDMATRLLHYWRASGMRAVSVSCGKTGGIDTALCARILDGLINMMLLNGLLSGPRRGEETGIEYCPPSREHRLVAAHTGFFLPAARVGESVQEGQKIGAVRNIEDGETVAEIRAPAAGILLCLRDYPVLYEHETIAIVLGKKKRLKLWPF